MRYKNYFNITNLFHHIYDITMNYRLFILLNSYIYLNKHCLKSKEISNY